MSSTDTGTTPSTDEQTSQWSSYSSVPRGGTLIPILRAVSMPRSMPTSMASWAK